MSRSSTLKRNNRLVFLLIGSGMGAALALLFAPLPGAKLRTELAEMAKSKFDKGRGAQREEVAASGADDRSRSDDQRGSNRNSDRYPGVGNVDLDAENPLELT